MTPIPVQLVLPVFFNNFQLNTFPLAKLVIPSLFYGWWLQRGYKYTLTLKGNIPFQWKYTFPEKYVYLFFCNLSNNFALGCPALPALYITLAVVVWWCGGGSVVVVWYFPIIIPP